jgi:hypothetical protein
MTKAECLVTNRGRMSSHESTKDTKRRADGDCTRSDLRRDCRLSIADVRMQIEDIFGKKGSGSNLIPGRG